MAKIVVLLMFFIALFMGFFLSAAGWRFEPSVAVGLALTGGIAYEVGRREALTDPAPTDLKILGAVFLVLGLLMFAAALAS